MATISAAKPMFASRLNKNKPTDPSYGTPAAVGKMIKIEVKPQFKTGTLFADDEIAEEKKAFNYADVILNTSHLPFPVANLMFGRHNGMGDTVNDESQYGGLGYIYGQVVDGKTTYVTVFLPKVKFDLPEESYETQGENINFQTPTINGKAYADGSGLWRDKKESDSMAKAITELESFFTEFSTTSSGDDVIIDDGHTDTEDPENPETEGSE